MEDSREIQQIKSKNIIKGLIIKNSQAVLAILIDHAH
jgi:hypothetical protein